MSRQRLAQTNSVYPKHETVDDPSSNITRLSVSRAKEENTSSSASISPKLRLFIDSCFN